MRFSRALAASLLVAALAVDGLVFAHAAAADPYPGKDDVTQAKKAEQGARNDVASIQQQLTEASARAEAADVALSTAAENYDVAVVKLQASKLEAEQAQQVAARANDRLDDAQAQVGRLAAATYREGGPIADLDVLLSPGGPDAVLERATMLRTVAAERNRTVHSMDSARVSATALQRQADLATKRQQEAATQLAAARAEAKARSDAAAATVAATAATRTQLIAKLATARKTTVSVEKARQAGIEEAARRRAEAKARREAAAARAAAQRQSRNSGDGSSGNGGSGNGSSGNGNGNSGSGSDARDDGPSTGSSSGSAGGGGAAVSWARRQIGLPYLWGGDGPGSYDCSGLVLRAWQQSGVNLPHSSRMQYQLVQKISYGSLRPGDLIFYATDTGNPGTIHHVTIYSGGGMMIEAPFSGSHVREVPLRRGESMPYAGRP